jgi:hypothetical protein
VEKPNIPGLIKQVPEWHLLKRAEELRGIIALLEVGAKHCSANRRRCGATLAEELIYSTLNAFHRPAYATEDNRFDMWHLLPYLYYRAIASGNPESEHRLDSGWWPLEDFSKILLSLYMQRDQAPGMKDYELINFLGEWSDFLMAEVNARRAQAR